MPHVDSDAPQLTNSDAAMWRTDHASAIRYIEDLLRERRQLAPVIEAANERIRELEAQLAMTNSVCRAMHDSWVERNDTIGEMDRRIKELEEGAVKANELIELYKSQRDENDQEAQECADHCLALEAEVARLRPLAEVGRAVGALPVRFGLSHAAEDLWLVWDSRELEDELDETCGETALAALQKLAALRAAKGECDG